jgi:hypothetical protein
MFKAGEKGLDANLAMPILIHTGHAAEGMSASPPIILSASSPRSPENQISKITQVHSA